MSSSTECTHGSKKVNHISNFSIGVNTYIARCMHCYRFGIKDLAKSRDNVFGNGISVRITRLLNLSNLYSAKEELYGGTILSFLQRCTRLYCIVWQGDGIRQMR